MFCVSLKRTSIQEYSKFGDLFASLIVSIVSTIFSLFCTCISRYEKCVMLSASPQPRKHSAQFIPYEGSLEVWLVLLHLKRLNSLRWLSSTCYLLNSYVSSLILAFFSSVLLWKHKQSKTLEIVWDIYCPRLSFLYFRKQMCFSTRRWWWYKEDFLGLFFHSRFIISMYVCVL